MVKVTFMNLNSGEYSRFTFQTMEEAKTYKGNEHEIVDWKYLD